VKSGERKRNATTREDDGCRGSARRAAAGSAKGAARRGAAAQRGQKLYGAPEDWLRPSFKLLSRRSADRGRRKPGGGISRDRSVTERAFEKPLRAIGTGLESRKPWQRPMPLIEWALRKGARG